MTLRRWERWLIIEVENDAPDIRLVGRHFTRWGAKLAASSHFTTTTLATVAYWNSLWPDDRILSMRQEVTRAA